METPKFNSQQKVDLEKKPQENEESLSTQEQESGKRKNIILEIDGQKIEAVKYYFEYPERIQKETLIKGYTKYKIDNESLQNFIKMIEISCKKRKEELNEEKRYLLEKYPESVRYRDPLIKKKYEKEFSLIADKEVLTDPVNLVLDKLSNGDFPKKTYNHVINADRGHAEDSQRAMMVEKFILGKIENLNKKFYPIGSRYGKTVEAVVNNQQEIVMIGDFEKRIDTNYIKFTPFIGKPENGDNNIVEGGFVNYELSSQITEREFDEILQNNTVITTMGGVYTCFGKFWFNPYKYFNGYINPVFGFDMNEDVFSRYVIKVKELYDKLPQNIISNKNRVSVEHLISDFEDKNSSEVKGSKLYADEVMIPIMGGKIEVPEFRWGHAKYAVIPTEKNFNFLIIDHLPVKEEVNSSQS